MERSRELRNSEGDLIGRAMLTSDWESAGSDFDAFSEMAGVFVGGVEADYFTEFVGAFVGEPLTAARLQAFPAIGFKELRAWIELQACLVADHPSLTPWDLMSLAEHARSFGAVAPSLPCVTSSEGPLNRGQLTQWLEDRDTLLLINPGGLLMFYPPGKTLMCVVPPTLRIVILPDNGLLVDHVTAWRFPAEIAPSPRDERFANLIQTTDKWHAPTWWYTNGSFGSIGLTIRTIAEVWDIDIVDAVSLLEPLAVREEHDDRLELQLVDGGSIRIDAYRIRRPARDSQPKQ